MDFTFNNDGTLELTASGKKLVSRSPVGTVVLNGELIAPQSAKISNSRIELSFDGIKVVLSYSFRKNSSLRLEVTEIPDEVDHFVFGPYISPDAVKYGEILGAAWQSDGSVVCIQSLNPKTTGELEFAFSNKTDFPAPNHFAAGISDGKTVLSCSATNMTRPRRIENLFGCNMKNVIAAPVPLPDGSIIGSAVVLTYGKDKYELLDDICKLEVEEGMPHPTVDGEWAKTSLKATDIYFVFSDGDTDRQLEMAEKANVHCVYYSDPFKSWGHFEINPKLYPGGIEQFRQEVEKAHSHGVNAGFHTLSNFIHTHDPYVSPVPHKDLLDYDPEPIINDLSETDTEIFIPEELNYSMHLTLSAVRVEDEIIQFTGFDKEKCCLIGCKRGAFHTKAVPHKAGSIITHLADHGYGTLFPSINLQGEMADRIGTLIRDCKIRRMSFDGMEGCFYTGLGEYAASEYVRRVFEKAGNDLLCDASGGTHYRWHAHTYFNWGEPWYDYDHRGGMPNYRSYNQDYFRRNLIPGMLGWFLITDNCGRFEPTMPETLEYILSRMIAFDAGLCFSLSCHENERYDGMLATMKLWQEFRHSVKVPEEIKNIMKDKHSNWHLEKKADKWVLSKLNIEERDLGYCDQAVRMESGTTGYTDRTDFATTDGVAHSSIIVLDRSNPDSSVPEITEPLYCRIRLGTPGQNAEVKNFSFYEGWYSEDKILTFKMNAKAGDYLVYKGGNKLMRYDCNMNFIEEFEGEGREVMINGDSLRGLTMRYEVCGDNLQIMFKAIRTASITKFPIR